MIDFVEYVVAEMKSKRLSRVDASSLIKQFSRPLPLATLHPLAQRNSSDLSGQRYSSEWTGEESFLADHQVKRGGERAERVLPGVAYLEMARVAVEQASGTPGGAWEFRNTVWAQPIVVNGNRQVHIGLSTESERQIDYEVYTEFGEEETVHCQGSAQWVGEAVAPPLNLEQLKSRMSRGQRTAEDVYAMFARIGFQYGAAYQSIRILQVGDQELLAHLYLPPAAKAGSEQYGLHPSVLDGAVQSAAGLIDKGGAEQLRLPFALESLRYFAACTHEMYAWVRYTPGSGAGDAVMKLDIDVCDELGNVCAALRGLSSRSLTTGPLGAGAVLLARPVWEARAAQDAGALDYERRAVLCGLPGIDVGKLGELSGSHCERLSGGGDTAAERYSECAVACFERIQTLLQDKAPGWMLLQVVVGMEGEQSLLAGLSGLLQTAALENPRLLGQLIVVSERMPVEELSDRLAQERLCGQRGMIRYLGGERQALTWREVSGEQPEEPREAIVLREDGVYLITGGLGGLGVLFAQQILDHTRVARVVLSGRFAAGSRQAAILAHPRVIYRQVDLGDMQQVRALIAAIEREQGALRGILHSAGKIADNFILKKKIDEFRSVLEPKVLGSWHLDEASRNSELDFFVMFSSAAGALGNAGQSDYAAANGFMDQFAMYRNGLVLSGERSGLTRSINWGLWASGGMGVDVASRELLQQTVGMRPMSTENGIKAFYRSLTLPSDQLLVIEGELPRLRRALLGSPSVAQAAPAPNSVDVAGIDRANLLLKTEEYLCQQLSSLLKVPSHRIDPRAGLEKYGIDSVLAMKLTNRLEQTFGSLSKTLFFEYQTIAELSTYFVGHHEQRIAALFSMDGHDTVAQPTVAPPVSPSVRHFHRPRMAPLKRENFRFGQDVKGAAGSHSEAIAIIGISGRYPGGEDLAAYWANLRSGKDCIVEVPRERWDWRDYYSSDRTQSGHHFSKWGGFIGGVDEFDPLFFNISPGDAEFMDPQERLFLQHAWMAVEDAGYSRTGLQDCEAQGQAAQVGVYVGLMYSEYQLLGAGRRRVAIAVSPASIANRVSYVLNLHGPSMTLDTMCSSSLTAIHLASQDLKLGRTSLAIAGGVNVSIHPNKYLVLSAGQFISSDGHCQSFGEGGDGYIPGEGVGVVVLKRLREAERDGDHIYGVIRGSALNHGGKTNGYTVPNPQMQAAAIAQALSEAGVEARHVSYIEAHGTGTKLGDPIEIAALSKAFGQQTGDRQFCWIGSAKSNIGHCESAAGIAGLTKVLLQMEHGEIAPSLHSEQLNPHIDFDRTPFTVNQQLRAWERPVVEGRTLPRIAGISSFGAGGSNAHIIVEEYRSLPEVAGTDEAVLVLLSARTAEQLGHKVRHLLAFVESRSGGFDLPAFAYTLQVGREAMEERLGVVVTSVEQLEEKLRAWISGDESVEGMRQGQARRNLDTLSLFQTDTELKYAVDQWMEQKKLSRLLELWVKGLEFDWGRLYREGRPRRISLPAYPFAKDRYWVDLGPRGVGDLVAGALLHPLLHRNTSDFHGLSYSSTFSGEEFFFTDHRLNADGQRQGNILPGVAYLEMVRVAVEQAWPEPPSTVLELQNVVWMQPCVGTEGTRIQMILSANDHKQIDYEIYSSQGEQEKLHCQGRAFWSDVPAGARLNLAQLKGQMALGQLGPDSIYPAFAWLGLVYGTAFQSIASIYRGNGQVMAQLLLPKPLADYRGSFVLHPSLMDGALQAAAALVDADSRSETSQLRIPFALDALRIFSACTPEMFAWVRYAPNSGPDDNVVKVDIDLCDDRGKICVQMRGFSARVLESKKEKAALPPAIGSILLAPAWQAVEAHRVNIRSVPSQRHVILIEMRNVNPERLRSLLSLGDCVMLATGAGSNAAERYSAYAIECFSRIQSMLGTGMLGATPGNQVLVQIVSPDMEEQALFLGLSALLRTAMLEDPQLIGQLISVPHASTSEELATKLQVAMTGIPDSPLLLRTGAAEILRWKEIPYDAEAPHFAFRDDGVYLITGGLGALGLLFAREILATTHNAQVILTGRSLLTPEKESILDTFAEHRPRLSYRQLDLTDESEVGRCICAIRQEHHRLHGILHIAGMTADNFILKKTEREFSRVLRPKVAGTFHLDRATQQEELDFFVLFSSAAGVLGNPGQSDYAAANGFMDCFAAYRNRQVAAGLRYGRTRSINWPLWQAGGMTMDASRQEFLRQTSGIFAMQTSTGIEAFYRILALPYDQVLVAEGDLGTLRPVLLSMLNQPAAPSTSSSDASAVGVAVSVFEESSLVSQASTFLCQEFSGVLRMPAHRINPEIALEEYGIDSIVAMKLTNQLELTFGTLSKTLFFEYQTIATLAAYFAKAYPAVLEQVLRPAQATVHRAAEQPVRKRLTTDLRTSGRRFESKVEYQKDIAIVGVAGRYPQAENLKEFWENLKTGRDCITEIPRERWDRDRFYDADRSRAGKSYSKWGGFLADVDRFDPLFFNISPREAELMDPQERMFLETAWQTIEDAGYSKQSISGRKVGVYVGVMWGHYELWGAESILHGGAAIPNSSHASIANRVSYFFDLHGPSVALDTMCSSSLTAIHLACEEIRRGEIEAAIAGGVSLTIHPYKHLSLSQGRFASSDGKCRTFGAGGDGYVPGEGVGAILLKPLQAALQDGDQIYAVIRSSAVNHAGKTNGYTVPNPVAQAELIQDALKKANIDPATLSYVEAHGTGTALGDPIEIAGLTRAFSDSTAAKQFCPIGSVKSNIGHLESAAGIAAVTKVLLQLKHRQLVPSLHADPPNPNIHLADSPFFVQTNLADWNRPADHPRRAGISSFGAGGSNAHLLLEEYCALASEPVRLHAAAPEVFVLSAQNAASLHRYAKSAASFFEEASAISLVDIAYTSQVGRTAMDARLAIVASSVDDLKARLQRWILLQQEGCTDVLEQVYCGDRKESSYSMGGLMEGRTGKTFLEDLWASNDLEKIAKLWVLGIEIDWSLLRRDVPPRRVSLPTYPFARERYWLEVPSTVKPAVTPVYAKDAVPAEENRTSYYCGRWIPEGLTDLPSSERVHDPILVLDASNGSFRVDQAWQEHRGPVVVVQPGPVFEEIDNGRYALNYTVGDHFDRLLVNLKARGIVPSTVLHCSPDACDLETDGEVERQLTSGVYALFYLAKAWMRLPARAPMRWMSVYRSHSDESHPLGAGIGGFLRTLTLENPDCSAKLVELQETTETGELLAWKELCSTDWISMEQIRYAPGGERFCLRLVPETAGEESRAPLPIRKGGVYLITGGLGGLGLIFAQHLAQNYQAKLVLLGRSQPNARQHETLERLRARGSEVLVCPADVSQWTDVAMAVERAKTAFSSIHGVIHAAGVTRDALLFNKSSDEMMAVFASKVAGTIHLDRALKNEPLEFCVFFSSVAGVFGNPGQSDYAYANCFLNAFAERREQMRKARQRSGQTISISWPLWEDGGMSIPAAGIARLEEQTGLYPLPAQVGIRAWEEVLRSGMTQPVVLHGVPSRIAAHLTGKSVRHAINRLETAPAWDGVKLFAQTEAYLKQRIGEELKLSAERIDSSQRLEAYGMDSITITAITTRLEKDLGELPKAMLYEQETVQELTRFLLHGKQEALTNLFGEDLVVGSASPAPVFEGAATTQPPSQAAKREGLEPIAIIGVHGEYPHSDGLDEYWENLKQGRDLIDPIPAVRWKDEELRGQGIACKWGGFLDHYDQFDPAFFNIEAEEARMIDPQERLFLQSVWAAFEDAGYTRDRLRKRFSKGKSANVGVFVGVTTNSYHLWAPEEQSLGNRTSPSALPWSIANRVSYFFDFNGPSLPVDTACSSSLVAVHLACESLRNGDCQIAVAGGVNLHLHPSKYQSLTQRGALAAFGKCRSYGAGDDGFVPGEGVGSLILKPLTQAIEDGDRVHAVIAASAFDHSGRSNGYSAPNPSAQANLIGHALRKAGVAAESISYVEGHGTGTQLGDAIEVAALTQAFRAHTSAKQFCALGSVKANIGHSESAAGMAGMAKVVLQMKHRQLAPSLHADPANPDISFAESPFYLQRSLYPWPSPEGQPRMALINSFGAGGVNACVVLQEQTGPVNFGQSRSPGPLLFVLSAKNKDRLREYARRLLSHITRNPDIDFANLCYTLQTGREPMAERLAICALDPGELRGKLTDWIAGTQSAGVYRGSPGLHRGAEQPFEIGQGDQVRSLDELAAAWVGGREIDWQTLYNRHPAQLVTLPTYPFARERYWFSDVLPQAKQASPFQLHPLLHYNSSTLKEVSFTSGLTDTGFYARDHQVGAERIFPGAGFLEMACIAGNVAGESRVRRMKDVVWIQPLLFQKGTQTLRTSLKPAGDSAEYVIASFDDRNEIVVHCEGQLLFDHAWTTPARREAIAIDKVRAQCTAFSGGAAFYEQLSRYGLQYGPSFQTVQEVYSNASCALAKLRLAEHLQGDSEQYILHPALIDGALQTIAAMVSGESVGGPFLPFAADEVEILGSLPSSCYAYAERTGATKFNIQLLNETGEVLIELKGLFVRPLPPLLKGAATSHDMHIGLVAAD